MAASDPVPGGLDALPDTLYLTCPQCDVTNVVMNVDLTDPDPISIDPCAGDCGATWTVQLDGGAAWWTRKEAPSA